MFVSLAQNWWRRGRSSETEQESDVCQGLTKHLKQTQVFVDLKFFVKGCLAPAKEVVAGPFCAFQ